MTTSADIIRDGYNKHINAFHRRAFEEYRITDLYAEPHELDYPSMCPFTRISTIDGRKTPITCGKCLFCRKNTIAKKLPFFEAELAQSKGIFITLTYKTPVYDLRELQLLHKRLRYYNHVFKYKVRQELGPRSLRPHLHILYFVLSDLDLFLEEIHRQWDSIGIVRVEPMEAGAINYVAGYGEKLFVPYLTKSATSTNPRIGSFLLTENIDDQINYLETRQTDHLFITPKGRSLALPTSEMRKAFDLDTESLPVEWLYPEYPNYLEYVQTCDRVKVFRNYLSAVSTAFESFLDKKMTSNED